MAYHPGCTSVRRGATWVKNASSRKSYMASRLATPTRCPTTLSDRTVVRSSVTRRAWSSGRSVGVSVVAWDTATGSCSPHVTTRCHHERQAGAKLRPPHTADHNAEPPGVSLHALPPAFARTRSSRSLVRCTSCSSMGGPHACAGLVVPNVCCHRQMRLGSIGTLLGMRHSAR